MMSGLEVLGVASSIMQVIGFAKEVVELCRNVYKGGSPNEELTRKAATLMLLFEETQDRCRNIVPSRTADRNLMQAAERCFRVARALDDEVKFITAHQKAGSLKSMLRVAAKTTWRRNRLEKLEKSLREHQNTMETVLLWNVCKQTDAIDITMREEFNSLSKDLRLFISQFSSGHKKLSELVNKELLESQLDISRQLSRLEISMSENSRKVAAGKNLINRDDSESSRDVVGERPWGIKEIILEEPMKEQRDHFLQSLRFNGMNERVNQLSDAHPGTFHWIFDLEDESTDEEDGFTKEEDVFADREDGLSNDENESSNEDKDWSDYRLWDNFNDWLKSESDIYWISGKPGSGKSTLMKFLTTSSYTTNRLCHWREGPGIVSHFFWKPGNEMQSNMKGFYCNILHQLLSTRPSAIASLLNEVPSRLNKESPTDWSLKELGSLFQEVLKDYSPPICLFVDGMDEIVPSERATLTLEIKTIRKMGVAKICVSSRPEQHFSLNYGRFQQLKMQELTLQDMYSIARAQLQNFDLDPPDRQTLIDELTIQASGVILWLILAIRSISTGLENGDATEELFQRLELLPDDLSKLYAEMWKRTNDSKEIYHKTAARYFNLIIAARHVNGMIVYPRAIGLGRDEVLSVLQLTIAAELVSERLSIDDGISLKNRCQRACTSIKVRSAGLLDLIDLDSGSTEARLVSDAGSIELGEYARLIVQFIHRTAFDFLTDTEDGLEIRQADSCALDQYRLVLLESFLLAAAQVSPSNHFVSLRRFIDELASFKNPSLASEVERIFWLCKKYYDEGSVINLKRGDWEKGVHHYFAVLMSPAFEPLVLQSIQEFGHQPRLATSILRDFFDYSLSSPRFTDYTLPLPDLLAALLKIGADPHERSPMKKPVDDVWPPAGYSLSFTGFEMFLFLALSNLFLAEALHIGENALQARSILRMLLDSDLNLDTRVPFALRLRSPREYLPDFLNFNAGRARWQEPESMVPKRIAFILEVNLAYLVRWLSDLISRFLPGSQPIHLHTSGTKGVAPISNVLFAEVLRNDLEGPKRNFTSKYYLVSELGSHETLDRLGPLLSHPPKVFDKFRTGTSYASPEQLWEGLVDILDRDDGYKQAPVDIPTEVARHNHTVCTSTQSPESF